VGAGRRPTSSAMCRPCCARHCPVHIVVRPHARLTNEQDGKRPLSPHPLAYTSKTSDCAAPPEAGPDD